MPSKERGPAKAAAPLKSLPTSNVTAGTAGSFPEPVSPVSLCCDVPSFLLSLSLRAFAMIHVCPWKQMVVHIKQTTVPFPWGGRQTIPVWPWKQLKQCQASAQLRF